MTAAAHEPVFLCVRVYVCMCTRVCVFVKRRFGLPEFKCEKK